MPFNAPSQNLTWTMTVATFRDEVAEALQAFAWRQWSQLGVSGAPPRQREERAMDPEALLLFTLEIGRRDPRLFDEVLDWLASNEPLVSVQRLRNLCATADDRAMADAALDWAKRARGRHPSSRGRSIAGTLKPVFTTVPLPPRDALDPDFAKHGLARSMLERSGKSQAPRLREPIGFAFRLRRLLGVGVRAEVLRTLLTIRAYQVPLRVITDSAAFTQRNVREGLTQLHEAGVIASHPAGYSANAVAWSVVLELDDAPSLPLYFDWISTLRALSAIHRWLDTSDLDELSPYLLASRARTLVATIENDLRAVVAPVEVYARQGTDFWETFMEVTRAAIRSAYGPRASDYGRRLA